MENIKNIILDLGGVLINLDYDKVNDELGKLGLANAFTKSNQIDLFDNYEEGKINEKTFLNRFNQLAAVDHSHNKIIQAWNSILLDFPADRLTMINQLRDKYKVFLYSNTNFTHIKAVNSILQREHSLENLNGYFDKVYLSHELGIRKPKPQGFKHILKTNNLVPKETLFIDDSPQHIEGAKQAGIYAEWLDLEKEDLKDALTRLSLI